MVEFACENLGFAHYESLTVRAPRGMEQVYDIVEEVLGYTHCKEARVDSEAEHAVHGCDHHVE